MINVFLVEDDKFMVRLYKRAFKLAGFKFDIILDGETAINTLISLKEKPDVVLLDVMTPEKSGFEVLKIMKENEELKNIPVILLTNLYGEENEKKGLSLGAVMYVTKSEFNSREIVDKIKDTYEKYSPKK